MAKRRASRITPDARLAPFSTLVFLVLTIATLAASAFVLVPDTCHLTFASRGPTVGPGPSRHDNAKCSFASFGPLESTSENAGKAESVEEYKFMDKSFVDRTKRWVVIVDDEESIRLAVGDYLYDQGYQVTACADADALLEVCSTPKSDGEPPAVPDVIVSDIRMPGKDGLELLGLLRADERLERVPVVLLTAKSLTQDRVEGYRAGADAYLCKPFDPDELLAIIDNAIRRRGEMSGKKGKLVDLKADMSNIKAILRRNGQKVVRATDVYLTPAEREVLELLCKGYSNGEIASERDVNVLGVNRTIQNLYLKTQTRTRTELVRWAIKTGHVSARRF